MQICFHFLRALRVPARDIHKSYPYFLLREVEYPLLSVDLIGIEENTDPDPTEALHSMIPTTHTTIVTAPSVVNPCESCT